MNVLQAKFDVKSLIVWKIKPNDNTSLSCYWNSKTNQYDFREWFWIYCLFLTSYIVEEQEEQWYSLIFLFRIFFPQRKRFCKNISPVISQKSSILLIKFIHFWLSFNTDDFLYRFFSLFIFLNIECLICVYDQIKFTLTQ